jgi:hypothetical protein
LWPSTRKLVAPVIVSQPAAVCLPDQAKEESAASIY